MGVAYILAVSLAKRLGKLDGLIKPLLELFTLGTIADLAPLTGVNRRWVKRGLQLLPYSQLAGVKALIRVSDVKAQEQGNLKQTNNQRSLKPDDIGFRLGPRINAVGRIADPQIVIELLTTDDKEVAETRATQCQEINQRRQELCLEIEEEAIAWCEKSQINLQQERVLVVIQPGWHHGVIGIVASRLVERYGVPVFIGSYEEEQDTDFATDAGMSGSTIRGSSRRIPEFNVFEALQFCDDLLGKYGGHKAAGGFSLSGENLDKFRSRLSEFAHQCLEIHHLKPLVTIDAEAEFPELNFDLFRQIDLLHPCGIENKSPIFYTRNVRLIQQRIVGKGHIKLTLVKGEKEMQAIAWRWGNYFPLPQLVDIAYQLRENTWNYQTNIQLELVGLRLPIETSLHENLSDQPQKAEFSYSDRSYTCSLYQMGDLQELRIRNSRGEVLAIQQGKKFGLLGKSRNDAKEVDVSQPRFFHLIKAAMNALKLN